MKLTITPQVQDIIRGLPPQTKRYIREALSEISKTPSVGKPLRDELTGLQSFRTKRFRIVYQVQHSTVIVFGVGPRETIYDDILAARRTAGA